MILINCVVNKYVAEMSTGFTCLGMLKRLVAGFPPRRPGFKPGFSHVGFVVDKVALGNVFSE
jgi:hypothetical protein